MGLIAHRTPGARWTLIGQPPGNTPLIDGPTIPDDEAVEVVPAEQLRGAVEALCEIAEQGNHDGVNGKPWRHWRQIAVDALGHLGGQS